MFGSEIDIDTYRRNFVDIKKKVFDVGRKSAADKAVVLEKFSISEWDNLSDGKKKKHSIFYCKEGCLQDDVLRSTLQKFPIRSAVVKARAEKRACLGPKRKKYRKKLPKLLSS